MRSASGGPGAGRVFHPLLERLLGFGRSDRKRALADVRAAIGRYPRLAGHDLDRLVRGYALNDALNRVVFRLQVAAPLAAAFASRCVRVSGRTDLGAGVPPDRPIVVALMHFGPVHFAVLVIARLFRSRRAYIFHAGGELGHSVRRMFARAGLVPLVTGADSLRIVRDAIARDPRVVVIVAFDHLGAKRAATLPFLGASLDLPTGIAYLADVTGAAVVTAWWEGSVFGGLRIGERFETDRGLAPEARREAFAATMGRVLEERVLAAPSEWTEWPFVVASD